MEVPPGRPPAPDVPVFDAAAGVPEAMLSLVYAELRRLAASYLRRERPGHTLQPTALVHEAYVRLLDQRQIDWSNRAQFMGLAAVMMRRISVEAIERKINAGAARSRSRTASASC